MNILYVITKSNFGGAQRYVFELAAAAKEHGHEVSVACGGKGVLVEKLTEQNITVHPIKSFQRDVHIYKEFSALFELAQVIKEADPDVIHLNSSKAGGIGGFVARLLGVPQIVFTAHGWPFLEPRNIAWRTLAWLGSYLTALLSHRIILVSHNDHQATNMPLVKHKLQVIHTAVPEIEFLERDMARRELFGETLPSKPQGDFWLVTNAELNHNKNIMKALEAVTMHNKTCERKIFYSIIGAGELQSEIESLITRLEIADAVKLLGYVPDARRYLKAFDGFLLPSKKEGLPYALLEAGNAGLPCVASKVGGIPEVITDSESGLLIDPNDGAMITDALLTLTNNQTVAEKLGNSLKNKVENEFALHTMVATTLSVY